MTRDELLEFLRAQPWAVEASTNKGKPQAAVVGVAVTDKLELVFDTLNTSRKASNLRANPRIAVVIGWDDGSEPPFPTSRTFESCRGSATAISERPRRPSSCSTAISSRPA